MLRAAGSLFFRSLLWIALSALIVVGALRFGPTLLAQSLPEEIRPKPADVAAMTPKKILDGLKDIRGALD